MEISRWWSAAKPPEPAPIKDSAPNAEWGGGIGADPESRAPAGAPSVWGVVPVVLAPCGRSTTG